MTTLGIDLNDAGIIVVDGRTTPVSAPGYAIARGRELLLGCDAWKMARLHPQQTANRFWRDLSDKPLPRLMGGEVSAADLVHAQLENLCEDFMEGLEGAVFAVPSHWSGEQLGMLLGIAEDLAIPVLGLIDNAVAATRREYPGRELLHLDASLHALTIAQMDQNAGSSVRSRREIGQVGVDSLERTCVEFIARQFVENTRFDPLHDGQSEQYLYDHLYSWLERLTVEKEFVLTIEFGGNQFDATVTKSDLMTRVIDRVEPVVQNIRSLLAVGIPAALQITDRLTAFPGFVEAMERIPRATVFALEPGATAMGALQRAQSLPPTDGGVRLIARMVWDQAPMEFKATDQDQPETASGSEMQPTHVLFEGRAYRLDSRAFNVGSVFAPGDYGVALAGRVGGVSRRHFSIRVGRHGVEVIDHSRYGTLLNGHVVDGAAILQSGDVVSLGQPECEFLLITEVSAESDDHGAQKV